MGDLARPLDPDGWVPRSAYERLRALPPKADFVRLDDLLELRRNFPMQFQAIDI